MDTDEETRKKGMKKKRAARREQRASDVQHVPRLVYPGTTVGESSTITPLATSSLEATAAAPVETSNSDFEKETTEALITMLVTEINKMYQEAIVGPEPKKVKKALESRERNATPQEKSHLIELRHGFAKALVDVQQRFWRIKAMRDKTLPSNPIYQSLCNFVKHEEDLVPAGMQQFRRRADIVWNDELVGRYDLWATATKQKKLFECIKDDIRRYVESWPRSVRKVSPDSWTVHFFEQ